jgi:hypothetical protein
VKKPTRRLTSTQLKGRLTGTPRPSGEVAVIALASLVFADGTMMLLRAIHFNPIRYPRGAPASEAIPPFEKAGARAPGTNVRLSKRSIAR